MTTAVRELSPVTENLLRTLAPQVLGVLARRSGDFAGAEDAVQEALLAAADHWPREGVPDNPRGWLIHSAVAAIPLNVLKCSFTSPWTRAS